jgi:uncharacterized membrane protein YGL010W
MTEPNNARDPSLPSMLDSSCSETYTANTLGYWGAEREQEGTTIMSTLSRYLAQYDHEHTNRWNKILHGIGIPTILVGIVLTCATFWRTGLVLFVGGWILLFLGHRIEGNRPAFLQGAIYFLVGPVWIAKELKEALAPNKARSAAPERDRNH